MESRKPTPEERQEKVKEEFGDKAQVVTPYKPNRKQRRAQASAKRTK